MFSRALGQPDLQPFANRGDGLGTDGTLADRQTGMAGHDRLEYPPTALLNDLYRLWAPCGQYE